MSVEMIAVTVLAIVVIFFGGALWLEQAGLRKELDRECEWRRKKDDEASDKHWDLRHEVASGFEELGLKRRPSIPAIRAGWEKA